MLLKDIAKAIAFNHPEVYQELAGRLSDRWYYSPLKIQFREIAHSVRNENFNFIHNTCRKINRIKLSPLLFPLNEIIPSSYLKISGNS